MKKVLKFIFLQKREMPLNNYAFFENNSKRTLDDCLRSVFPVEYSALVLPAATGKHVAYYGWDALSRSAHVPNWLGQEPRERKLTKN